MKPGAKMRLKDWPTRMKSLCESKDEYKQILEKHVAELERAAAASVWGEQVRAAAGVSGDGRGGEGRRDSARDVGGESAGLRGGCFRFKQPSADELEHDFLWRAEEKLPRGRIGIFNRSYYEEVLVVRVHPEILEGEGLADRPRDLKQVVGAAVSLDSGYGEAPGSQRDPDSEVLSPSLEGRAAEAVSGADR